MMRLNWMVIVILSTVFLNGCAKKVPVSYNKLEQGHYVYAETTSGESINGNLVKKNKDYLVIAVEGYAGSKTVARKNIIHIKCAPPVYDEKKKLISESEIKSVKTNKNFWLFTIGGSTLCFGGSFFLTANILHQMDKDASGSALWAPTAGGALLGGALFAIQGRKIDRRHAIEKIKENRKEEALMQRQKTAGKRKKISKKIKTEKKAREEQNQEIRKLLKKIDEKKTKENPE